MSEGNTRISENVNDGYIAGRDLYTAPRTDTRISENINYGNIAGRDVHVQNVQENVNHGYIVGRDLYLGDQYVAQETLFFEPDLRDVQPPAWTTSPKSKELARALAGNRLILLAGQDLDEKTRVARHLAWLLSQELTGEVRVREWYRSSDPQKIETAFHETATTILLLPQVLPHHIGHRLHDLQRRLHARGNYTIITTEGTRAEWGIASGSPDEKLWHELSWETYYGRAFLAERLVASLKEQEGRLPDWLSRDLQADSPLTEEITVEEAAARLKQPDRIRQFAQWMGSEEASPRALFDQLDQLAGDRAAIFQWYRELARGDQLLALGLVLFDGLPDDQIFAALEILVNEAWRRSDPNLPQFDYKDLERLCAYFRLAESGEDGTRIETSASQKREAILQAAWDLQRRRLLAVLPAMTRLLHEISPHGPRPEDPLTKDVTPGKSRASKGQLAPASQELWRFTQGIERELFSSPRRVEQLQRSIIEALSRIGLLCFEAVEASFLELAIDGSTGFRTVVAKALAAWRGEGHSEKLFKVLLAWWEDGCLAASAKSLAQKTRKDGEDPWTAMRGTVALAVGYALQYDQPNHLAPELHSLFRAMLKDRHPEVRRRVLELTLPLAAASHVRQLEPLLREHVISDKDHLYAIAFGVAMALSNRDAESLEIVERWHAFCRAQGPQEQSDIAGTPRDRLLSAVAMIYGYVRCDQAQGLLTPDEIVFALRSILASETSPFVRTHALMAMGLQAVDNFDLVASTLMELISEITLPDRLHVVSVLVRAYLRQREQFENGEEEIEIGGRTFQVWPRSQRPLTAIERSLFAWLQDERRPVVQQVAIQTFAAIAATTLDQKELELASRRAPAPDPPAPPPVVRVLPDAPRLRRLSPLGRLAVFLAIPRRKEIRERLLPVVAEVAEVRRTERSRIFETVAATASRVSGQSLEAEVAPLKKSIVPMVLARWQALEDEGMKSLTLALEKGLAFFRWRWPILLAAGLSCVLLVHDIRDWRWALGSSLTTEEEWTIHQRRATPLRLAMNLGLPELQRAWAQQKLEEERRAAAERLREAERMVTAALDPSAPSSETVPAAAAAEELLAQALAEAPEPEPEPKETEPAPLLTPVQRLRKSALSMLARMPENELVPILLDLEAADEQARLEAEAAREGEALPQEVAAAVPEPPPAGSRVSQVARPEPAAEEGTPVVEAETAPAPEPILEPVQEEPAFQPVEEPRERSVTPAPEPTPKPRLRDKLRWPFGNKNKKNKPPQGDGDGNG